MKNGLPRISVKSATRSRLLARLPRVLLMVALGVLALAGVRVIVLGAGSHPAPTPTGQAPRADLAMQGFAESFARAYLTFDARDPDAHKQAVSQFVGGGLDEDGGFTPPSRGRQSVRWTSAVATAPGASGGQIVTVACEVSTGQVIYLAVPVSRDERGVLSVFTYPAIVGPLAADHGASAPAEQSIEDPDLKSVAQRALQNYLIGDIPNLRADLDGDVVVTLPAQPLRGFQIARSYWASRGVVAVEGWVPAGAGGLLRLRYELGVVRHGERWFVTAIHVTQATTPAATSPTS